MESRNIKHLKLFEEYISPVDCKFSDAARLDIIENTINAVNNNNFENFEDEVDLDSLLDTYDGYPDQTYVQYNPNDNTIIYWEGWVKECWKALYNKSGYKGLSKEKAADKVVKERIIPSVESEFDIKCIEYENFWHETSDYEIADGYITKIIFKL